jgi:glycine/D-amino acid oxidase-like deaminating enzyme
MGMGEQAKILVVVGGIWGRGTAYHFARVGETDVVVLERDQEPFSETTSLVQLAAHRFP